MCTSIIMSISPATNISYSRLLDFLRLKSNKLLEHAYIYISAQLLKQTANEEITLIKFRKIDKTTISVVTCREYLFKK